MDKARPSPYSTGGGGDEYERMVGATYLVAMVCGDAAPGVDGTVTEVRFQQRNAGHLLDDLVVVSNKGGSTHRLSLQVRHGLRVGSSSEFRDIMAKCWKMFAGGEGVPFDRSADRLGIVVPRVTGTAHDHYLPAFRMARDSEDGSMFWSRLKHGGHSRRRLEFVSSIKDTVTNSLGSEATDDDMWRFLRLLHIIELDMDDPDGLDRTNVEGMCLRALAEPGEGEAAKLFDALRGVAADLAPAGASITTAALRGRLSSFGLAGHAKTKADVRHLDGHSREAIGLIQKTIVGKVALDRSSLLKGLGELAEAHAMTIIHGEPFAGKSALARLFAEKVPRPGVAIFLGTECLGGSGSLGAFLTSQGVRGSLEDILETHGAAPHRYIIIDGLDRISYEPEKIQVVKGLLAAVSRYNAGAAAPAAGGDDTSWKIIATTRSMELEHVANAVKEWCGGGRRPAVLEVGPLTNKEIDAVRRQLPQLGGDTLRLGGLLSFPGYLDMIARWQPASLEGVRGPVGAGRLYDLFWKDAVLRLGGLRGGKGHWLAREKILVDMADRAYRGLPPADLHGLDRDAVDGLLTDRLARTDGNRLAFAHDVIEDYALARMIEWAEPRRPLFEDAARSRRLVRPLRLCAAKMLEADGSADKWESLLEDCRLADGQIWARECLLGVADSDAARSNLDAISGALLRDGGRLLAVLLAALPSAFLKYNPHWDPAAKERGTVEPGLHPAYYKLPRDERFAPVLSFALDNMEGLGGAAAAQFIRTAAMWTRNGDNRDLKKRIAGYAVRHADWLHTSGPILGQSYSESDETKGLVVATIMYSSDLEPDLVKGLISGIPSIIDNEHFERGLIKEHGWAYLCKFLPDVAVDVLSRNMCIGPSSLGPLKDIPEMRDDGWTNMPSPYEGPFFPFLGLRPEHGLELVHRLLNHVTDEWRRAQAAGIFFRPGRIPLPQTVHLESGPVSVYGDEDAFTWGGHARRAPDLVASALMALEVWLDSQVRNGGEPAAALFEKVLRGTRSAAVVGVCCTVALRHMDKTAEAVLPILANPAFWIMDAERKGADMEGIDIVRMHERVSGRGQISEEKFASAIRHADGRCKLGDLSDFVPQLLTDGSDMVRIKMQEALEAFPNHVPVFFQDETNEEEVMNKRKRLCEIWSKSARRDNYTSAPTSNGSAKIVFDEARFLTGDEKETEKRRLIHEKVVEFTTWSWTFIQKNKIGPAFTIESALEYAERVSENAFLSSLPRHRVNNMLNGRANLAGAMVIHRWDRAVKMGVSDACLKYVKDVADTIDPRIESRYQYGPDQAVAYALPHCYLRGGRGRGARNAILKFADAHSHAVLESLMRGLCALWGREDKLVLECIARARRTFCKQRDKVGRQHVDWERYAASLAALHDVPPAGRSTERKLERMVCDMLDDTIGTFIEIERNRAYGGAYPLFRNAWCPGFFRALESYTAGRPALRDGILGRIVSHWEEAPQLLEYFMRCTSIWGLRAGRKADLLASWKYIMPRVIGPRLATWHYRNGRVKKSIIALLILADSPKAVRNEDRLEVVEGLAGEIPSWCAALAGNTDAIDAVASLLEDAPPALLLSHGIGWLWQVLQAADVHGLSGATVKMLSHLLHKASTCKRPDGGLPDLSAKYTWLVDCLVVVNDPVAESLKNEGKNPYADACGRGRR